MRGLWACAVLVDCVSFREENVRLDVFSTCTALLRWVEDASTGVSKDSTISPQEYISSSVG